MAAYSLIEKQSWTSTASRAWASGNPARFERVHGRLADVGEDVGSVRPEGELVLEPHRRGAVSPALDARQ